MTRIFADAFRGKRVLVTGGTSGIGLGIAGGQIGYEDVFSKIDMCRKHYVEVGLGANYIDQFVR